MSLKQLITGIVALGALLGSAPAVAGSPGLDALDDFRKGSSTRPAVQNRFFVKEARFELTPAIGLVPNNPFTKRYVGSLFVTYHFTENLAAEGQLSYSPDLGRADLKNLTAALTQIAFNGPGGPDFRQPLEKVLLSANVAARWTPLYGKINLLGEAVLNFDIYGVAGVGMISKQHFDAKYDPSVSEGIPVALEAGARASLPSPMAGIGANFFINQTVALRLDLRSNFYFAPEADYGNSNREETGSRLYNNLVASGGVALYFPKMQPRLYNF